MSYLMHHKGQKEGLWKLSSSRPNVIVRLLSTQSLFKLRSLVFTALYGNISNVAHLSFSIDVALYDDPLLVLPYDIKSY